MNRKKVLSKFTILCWAAFTDTLGHMQPVGLELDTLERTANTEQALRYVLGE